MNDFQSEQSRLASRGHKRKQNRLLNLLIAIVCILILIVGIGVFWGGSDGGGQSAQPSSGESSNGGGDNDSGSATIDNSDQQKNDDQNQGEATGTNSSDQPDGDTTSSKQSDETAGDQQNNPDDPSKTDENKNDEMQGGGPQGPWEPVKTQQESPHQTSYDDESMDWAEQVQAVFYGAGLSADQSTLWWMERDGTPDQSVGYVSAKNEPKDFYVVHIKWIDNKGWKPTKVDKTKVEDPQAWLDKKRSK